MAALSGGGISVELPSGWDGRIWGREVGGATRAALHAGTFGLPNDRGDFGSGAVEVMTGADVLVVLLEYDPACVGQPLFAAPGPPPALDPEAFSPGALQRVLPGQAGAQVFFSAAQRAFCLYVVVGRYADRDRLVARANQAVGGVVIDGR